MKNIIKLLPLIILAIIFSSCSEQPSSPESSSINEMNKNIISTLNEISPEEADGLIFMRQEEKVARDVYTTLGQTWNSNVFQKIKLSEQKHMDAIKVLLTRYNIIDPVTNDEVGVFDNPEFQQIFDNFVLQGQQSLNDAFITGKTIEEQDIEALENQLSFVDNPDIIIVYTNLKSASEKHLITFTNHITASF